MKKRVVVYGNANHEKEKLVSNLQISSSRDYSFESSTPNNRFRSQDSGFSTPLYSAPWQLLVVELNLDRLQKKPELESVFPQCDVHRPLVILFYGEENPKTNEIVESYQTSLASHQTVRILLTTELENISSNQLITTFYALDDPPAPKPDSPSF